MLEESSNAAINSCKIIEVLKWNICQVQELNGILTRLERLYSIMLDAKLPAAFFVVY
jgi:hypothetical protein